MRNEGLLRVGLLTATFSLIGAMLFQRPVATLRMGDAELLVRPWDLAWVAFVMFALPLTVRRLHAHGLRALSPPTKVAFVFCLYAVAAALSLTAFVYEFGGTGLPEASIRAARFILVAYAALVLSWELGPRGQTAIVAAIIAVSVIASAEALYAYAFDVKREIVDNRILEYGVTRPGGPFGNYRSDGLPDRWWASPGGATTLGLWLSVAIALSGAFVLRRSSVNDRLISRIPALASLPLLIAGLAVTASREAWVGGLVMLVFLFVMFWRIRTTLVLALAVGAAGVIVFAIAVSPAVMGRFIRTFTPGTFEFRTGPEARFHAWKTGLDIAWDRFPIGWGIGAVEEHPELFGTTTSESLYIQSLIQMGAIGAVLIVAFVWYGLSDPARTLRRNSSDLWSVLRFSVVAIVAIPGLFGYMLGDPTVEVLVALALVPSAEHPSPVEGLPRT